MSALRERIEVASLLGHSNVEMAIRCLGSLLSGSAEPLALRLHDDGSLTAADRERLAAALGDPTFVLRSEADERVAAVLARRPALAAFRRRNPLALKLVDAVLYAGDELAYCDTDVLFVRRFSGLFRLSAGAGALFVHDRQNAYSARSWHLLRHRRLRLARRVNTGIVVFRTAGYDPDLLEWYLARPELGFAPVWMEQTGWALLGQAVGCRLLDPAQVAIPAAGETITQETVALHFVSPVRALLPNYAPLATAPPAGRPPVVLRSHPAGRCRAPELAATEVARRLRRWRG